MAGTIREGAKGYAKLVDMTTCYRNFGPDDSYPPDLIAHPFGHPRLACIARQAGRRLLPDGLRRGTRKPHVRGPRGEFMQFGWLTLALSPSPDEDARRIDDLIDQACAAERLGFSDVWLTEHYFTGESVYNDSLMFAAALAMKTERIRIGFAVVQMPFHHPVRLAVQLALLDNLSKGRIDVGIGKGTVYNEYEFVGHGLRSHDSRERMEEAVDILERAWREAPLTYNGKFHKVHIPALRPKPVQQPGPPLWRSVISPGSFTECGRLGVPILTARLPVARIKERWAAYEAGLDAGGHDAPTRARLLAQSALWRNVYVAESDAQAEDELAGAAPRDARPHDACARRLQSGRLPARAGDAQRLDRSQGARLRGDPLRAVGPARSTARRRACASRWPSCATPASSICSARPASAP